jgi:O-antigen ligase
MKLYITFSFIFSLVLSLFFYEMARALVSISMIGILGSIILFNNPKMLLINYFKNIPLLVFSGIFFSLFIFFINSQNSNYAINRVEIKAPIFVLAIAFATIGKIQIRLYKMYLSFFVLLCLLSTFYTISKYLISYDLITESYLKAKIMPSIINHVRYSVVIAMGTYISYYLYIDYKLLAKKFRYFFLATAFILFIFLHIYSVRSGLVAIYGAVFIEILRYAYKSQKKIRVFSLFLGISIFIISAINLIPTLQNKWINTKLDIMTYYNGGYPNFNSLTTRFISYDAAISIFKEHPLFGCGIGDIKNETDNYFHQYYPMIEIPILPHNQFLFYLAGTGIFGLILFCFCFYFPLFYNNNWRNKILLTHYVMLTLSFMTEPMLETQLGVAFSLLFIFLPLSQEIKSSN